MVWFIHDALSIHCLTNDVGPRSSVNADHSIACCCKKRSRFCCTDTGEISRESANSLVLRRLINSYCIELLSSARYSKCSTPAIEYSRRAGVKALKLSTEPASQVANRKSTRLN